MNDETASRVRSAPDAPASTQQGASGSFTGRLLRVCLDVFVGALALALVAGIALLVAPDLLARLEQPALQAWGQLRAPI